MEINGSAIKGLAGKSQMACSLAIVDQVLIDEDEVLLKVTLQPTGEKPMVRMGWDYVGNAFGLYVLPEPQDEVLILFPGNDLNAGICIKRLNNGVDKIPKGISKDKILLIGMDGHNVDITIKGNVKLIVNGDVEVEANSISIKTGG